MATTSASAATAAATILSDHSPSVGVFFGSIRIPASFLAGAAFSGIFGIKTNEAQKLEPRAARLFRNSYSFFIFLCFLLSMNVLIVATVALTKNLHAGYDPMATSGYMLLKTQFEYEFILTRWSFIVGMLCFLVAVPLRIVYEFRLFETDRQMLGASVCLAMSSVLFNMLSFINTTLFCWNNMWDMTVTLLKLSVARLPGKRPLELLASVVIAIAAVLAMSSVL